MKGQIILPSKLMISALSFVILTVTIIGTLVHFQQYQVTYQSRVEYRQNIDLLENLISSKCLTFQENGRVWRGVLDKSRLDSLSSNSLASCVQFPTSKSFYVEIQDENNDKWTFGTQPSLTIEFEQLFYPVVVKDSSSQLAARMVVTTYG